MASLPPTTGGPIRPSILENSINKLSQIAANPLQFPKKQVNNEIQRVKSILNSVTGMEAWTPKLGRQLGSLVRRIDPEAFKDLQPLVSGSLKAKILQNKTINYGLFYDADVDMIKDFLTNGGDANLVNEDGESLLYWAYTMDKFEVVKLLLEHGADPNQVDKNGKNLLRKACLMDRVEIVKLLLEHRADPNQVDEDGKSLLYRACLLNKVEIIKLFLEHGADVNEILPDGRNLLMVAMSGGNKELVQLLIDKGADLNHKDSEGHSLLYHACLTDKTELVRLCLSKGIGVKEIDNDSNAYFRTVQNREQNWKDIRNILIQHLKKETVLEGREIIRRKLFGHVFEIGQLHVEGESVKLTGGRGPYYANQIAKSWQRLPGRVKEFQPKNHELIFNAFKSASQVRNQADLFKEWQSDMPVILGSGYENHHVGVLFWKNYMVVCDRSGTDAPPKNCRFHQIDRSKIDVALFTELDELRTKDEQVYLKTMAELPGRLGGNPILENEKLFRNQKVGNCTFANQEGLVLALSILGEIEAQPEASEKVKEIVEAEKATFLNWKAFQQITVLEKLLEQRNQSKSQIDFDAIRLGLLESIPVGGVIHPKIVVAWNNVERQFLEIASEESRESYLNKKDFIETSQKVTNASSKVFSLGLFVEGVEESDEDVEVDEVD